MKLKLLLFLLLFLLLIIYNFFSFNDSKSMLIQEAFENRSDFYIDTRAEIHTITISNNGKYIFSASEYNTVGASFIRMWDIETGKLFKVFWGHNAYIKSLAITPDGTKIVSASLDKSIKIWDISTGKLLHHLEGHNYTVSSLAITPDGSKLVSSSFDESIKIWDIKTGKELNKLVGHDGSINSIAIIPDGTIRLWDFKTEKEEKIFVGGEEWALDLF